MAILPSLNNLRGVVQKVFFVPIVYGFISILPMFLAGWENSDRLTDRLFSVIRSKENTFDFIIVGGGTAGALVANRLSEYYSVLLLEAGGTPSPFQTVPALSLKLLNHPQNDWRERTLPQKRACLNSVNQQSSWSSGKGLGGSTNINFMVHTRGHPLDYEQWAEVTGDPSWGYHGVLPYFKRSETFSGTSNDPEARGHDGELKIRKPSYIGLSEDWVRAGQELGYPFVDLNGRHEEGFGILQYPIFKGIRQSTYSAFLLPMHKSPRLHIRRYALVRKILFRDNNNMAYGVEYIRHGRVETVIATKEVILTAGTLGSSKLLMLSGVGPKAHLDELGIPVRSDLPVGQNLQDHLGVHLGPFFISEPKSFLFDRDVTPENIVRWLFLGTGPITTTGYQAASSVASTRAKSHGQGQWPDLHLMLHGQAIHKGYADAFAYAYGLQEDELSKYYSNALGRDSFHITVIGARPTSKGQVLLSGASISDPLVINPKYLEDNGDGDFKVLLEGVKIAMNIANTSIFQRFGSEFTSSKLPGCEDHYHGTDAYWECYIRRYTISMNNAVGTNAMEIVVDKFLRVKGTRGLRVLDASIQPTIVSTGTAASTFMIAEKGVDMILKDHGLPDRDTDLFDVVFGRNGFFKRNPVIKILQREFDTLNPLRALFKPFTSTKNTELDARAKYTQNSALNNPILQVISSLFGTSKGNPRRDPSLVSASENVNDINYNSASDVISATDPPPPSLMLNKRFGLPSEAQTENSGNVISKNQWVLQTSSSERYLTPRPLSVHNFPFNKIVKLGENEYKRLNIPEMPTVKGKGGRRFALLQALLRESKLNSTGKIQLYPKPEVKFLTSDNEIEDDTPKKPNLIAKPVNSFDHLGVLSVTTLPQSSADKFKPIKNAKPSPFDDLLKHIKNFENFILSLTVKDKPRSWSSYSKFAKPKESWFATSPSQNPFHQDRRGNTNIFSTILAALGSTNVNTTVTKSPINIGLGTGFSPNGSLINPFQFLFNGQASHTTTPVSIEDPFDLQLHNFTVSNTTVVNKNKTEAKSGGNTENIFSSWFKPSPATSTSSWFKPFEPPSPSTSWFQPSGNTGSNGNDNPNPLLKPFTDVANWFKLRSPEKSSPSALSFTSSSSSPLATWPKALNFDSDTQSAVSVTTPPSLPPTSDPLSDLFGLLFGGLKKHERRAIYQTLEEMADAGQNIVDFLGPTSKIPVKSQNSLKPNISPIPQTPHKNKSFFEQIATGKPAEASSKSNPTLESYNDFVQSLVSLNQFFNQFSTTTTSTTTTTTTTAKPHPLVAYLNTFEYPPSSSPPPVSSPSETPLSSSTPSTTTSSPKPTILKESIKNA